MNSPVSSPDTPARPGLSRTPFVLHEAPVAAGLDPRFDEALIHLAASNGPAACVWQAPQGLVVPRTYLRSAAFDNVCAQFAQQGWPVSVRHSGGGVVPQGPGILNVSLAYCAEGRPLDHSDAAYQLLCDLITQAVAPFGIHTHAQAVEGSFCDGRFNLACGTGEQARKVAGTAQLWRRLPHPTSAPVQVVLVHGLLLVAADIEAVTAHANALEQALGHSRRYMPERAASLHDLAPLPPGNTAEFVDNVREALCSRILEHEDG